MAPSNGWSTQQLTEFLAALGAAGNRAAALRLATERMAESVEAEVAVVFAEGRVVAQVGFTAGRVPRGLFRQLTDGTEMIEIAGLGPCHTLVSNLGGHRGVWLAVARAGDQPFSAEDRGLMRGMARILALTMHNLGLLQRERAARRASQRQAAEIRERKRLLETLGTVQRMIMARAPQQLILDRLVADVGRFVGDPIAALRLLAPDGDLHVVAATGVDFTTFGGYPRSAVGVGAGGMAMAEDRLVVIEDYVNDPHALPAFSGRGLQAAAAAPIRQEGKPIGSLVVASNTTGRHYLPSQLEALKVFAEHASLAITDAARTNQMLHLALHDALTGLLNRTLFSDRLNQRLRAGRRRHQHTAVLFIDIDNLKRVNDTLGHPAGDAVLVEVGKRLSASVKPADTVARLSGDEFTVLLDTVDGEQDAVQTAEKLLAALRRPLKVADRSLTLSASIGVRVATAGRDGTDDVLRGADLAMYDAKARRDGFVAVFHPDLDSRAARRLELESNLRAALDEGAFRVLYQPIISLRTGDMHAVEALVRWDRAQMGLVSPVEFIPMAEESGLIVELGSWVLEEACRTVAALEGKAGVPLRLSVNLSARQLIESGLEATVVRALAASGLAPERLTLEITESVLLTDTIAVVERLGAVRRLGVKVAIDDFGTGYSSLGYLRRLPLDAVKIDRTFIEHLTDDARQAALVRAIVELCRSLDLEIVAEGVETAAQARRLAELGCELAQGYHLGRPMPADALVGTLRRQLAVAASTPAPALPGVRRNGRTHSITPVAPVA